MGVAVVLIHLFQKPGPTPFITFCECDLLYISSDHIAF